MREIRQHRKYFFIYEKSVQLMLQCTNTKNIYKKATQNKKNMVKYLSNMKKE